jgi:hypothetical protein
VGFRYLILGFTEVFTGRPDYSESQQRPPAALADQPAQYAQV